jgi:PST family polysaccharide transporter
MSLRQKAVHGGAFLVFRQGIGIVLSLVGVLFVTRIIGPREYGLYAVSVGIANFLCVFGDWGLDVYLLRKTEDPEDREFHQVFTLLLCISAAFAVGLIGTARFLAEFVKMPEVAPLVSVLSIAVLCNLLATPAIVKLDRELNFKQVAKNELIAQISMYAVAVPLAFFESGAWAPTCGFLAQQFVLLVLSYWSAGYRPALLWDTVLVRRMVKYGFAFSASTWVWQLRGLVNPLIVGRFAGAAAVGYVAVGIRFVEVLSFVRSATWRIAMVALAKMNQDSARLRNSITEGMRLHALAVGVPLAMFALIAPRLVPLGLGHNWAPALRVFTFIALSYLANSMFSLHSSVLYMLGKNFRVTVFHGVHMILFAGSAAILVPRLGFVGYGWAEMIALFSYFVVHFFLAQEVGSPSYGVAVIWFMATACALILSAFGSPILYLGPIVLLLPLFFPRERSSMVGYAQIVMSRSAS